MTKTRNRETTRDGFIETKTETYFIVKFRYVGDNEQSSKLAVLTCTNASLVFRGMRKRRKWGVERYSTNLAYKFETISDARGASKSAAVKKWLKRWTEDKWIVELARRTKTEVTTQVDDVLDRPGCNPLLVLALEAE